MTEIESKIDKLIQWNREYREGNASVTDTEYDRLVEEVKDTDEYKAIEQSLNEGTGDVLHKGYVVGSLKKCKANEDEELRSWVAKNGNSYIVSSKCDGMSFVLHYYNGKLIDGITRGDGYKGISHKHKIKDIVPNKINTDGHVIIRGEMLIEFDKFEQLNQDYQTTYAHPRNAVTGLFNDKKNNIPLGEYCSFKAYRIIKKPSSINFESYSKELMWLVDAGFKIPFFIPAEAKHMNTETLMEMYESCKNTENFPIDGLVIQNNNSFEISDEYYPENARAWKSNLLNEQTTIIGYDWRLSKGGMLCPVAQIKPVVLDGATVSQATAYNYEYVKSHGLGIGAEVEIIKSGDIIPKIVSVTKWSDDFKFPEVCPECGAKLEVNGVHLCCTNKQCQKRQTKSLAHFLRQCKVEVASTKSLENWGIHTIEELLAWTPDNKMKQHVKFNNELYNKLFTKSPKDLLLAFDYNGIGTKTIQKIIDTNSLEAFISAYINNDNTITIKTTKGITKDTLERLWKIREDISVIYNLITTDKRYSGFDTIQSEARTEDLILSGQSFCFTGSLNYMSRTKAQELVEQLGGKAASGVSKSLTYLVTNDKNSGSSKNRKAAELGVKVIDEMEFYTIVKYDTNSKKQSIETTEDSVADL